MSDHVSYEDKSIALAGVYDWTKPYGSNKARWAAELEFADKNGYKLVPPEVVISNRHMYYEDSVKKMKSVRLAHVYEGKPAKEQDFPIYYKASATEMSLGTSNLLLASTNTKLL